MTMVTMSEHQVSIDVAWSPDNIDRRGYQYSALARIADLGNTSH